MDFNLIDVPKGYQTDLVLVISPYFDPKFAKRVIKKLSPKKLRYVVDSDARPEDIEKLLAACNGTDVKLALGVAKGILHIKGFYFKFSPSRGRRGPIEKHRFLFGSANATDAAFSGKRNAELLAEAELNPDHDKHLLAYLDGITQAIDGAKNVQVPAIHLEDLHNPPSLHFPSFTIRHRNKPSGFDSWLQQGRLVAKYPDPQQFLHVVVRLEKPLPQGRVTKIFATQGLIEPGKRNELRYAYLGQPAEEHYEYDGQDDPHGQWKSRYCVWTHLGFWLSNDCYKARRNQMRAKSALDRQAKINELLSQADDDKAWNTWKEQRKEIFLNALRQTFLLLKQANTPVSQYFHTKKAGLLDEDYYAEKFDSKVERDIYLARDPEFCMRYIDGYEFLKMPNFRQDTEAWDGFVRSSTETLALEAAKSRPNSMVLHAVEALDIYPDELGPDEISSKLRRSWGKVGEHVRNYFED